MASERGTKDHDQDAGARQRRGEGSRAGLMGAAAGSGLLDHMSDDDLARIEDRAQSLKERFSSRGPLARFVNDFRLLGSMMGDVFARRYDRVPGWAFAAIGLATLYAIDPFDIVPDMLPLLGQLDDVTVIAACLLMIEQELDKYRVWKGEPATSRRGERGRGDLQRS